MKTILQIAPKAMISASLWAALLVSGCAISHKRGSDANETVDYYLQNRGNITQEITPMVSFKNLTEAEVTIQWTVDDKGVSKDISITHDTLHNAKLNARLIEHLKSMTFPKAPRMTTTTVAYTYKFTATPSK